MADDEFVPDLPPAHSAAYEVRTVTFSVSNEETHE
eukprot:SAG31_NODE_689_length_12806_cov_5.358857_10_plen_35_part_00